MYRQNSEKALWGGGGVPSCPHPATLMAGSAKEADIWFGRESAREARGKFKDLVCLVVFLCWIKRFVLLYLCLKCKYMNRYFSSFQKSRGGRSPPEKFEGGTRPPRPPRDRRLCMGVYNTFQLLLLWKQVRAVSLASSHVFFQEMGLGWCGGGWKESGFDFRGIVYSYGRMTF